MPSVPGRSLAVKGQKVSEMNKTFMMCRLEGLYKHPLSSKNSSLYTHYGNIILPFFTIKNNNIKDPSPTSSLPLSPLRTAWRTASMDASSEANFWGSRWTSKYRTPTSELSWKTVLSWKVFNEIYTIWNAIPNLCVLNYNLNLLCNILSYIQYSYLELICRPSEATVPELRVIG